MGAALLSATPAPEDGKPGRGPFLHNFGALLAPPESIVEPIAPAVLVLGGSTFMGRETVAALLARSARVCVVNRGRCYWGTNDPTGGCTARVVADRSCAREYAARVGLATDRLQGRWALVADFSALSRQDTRAALAGLRGRFDTYVHVSSDSVYEVSAWAAAGWQAPAPQDQPVVVAEDAGVRPASALSRWQLWFADTYGHRKLEAEEALAAALAEDLSAGRGVMLRLPDVIGPFDDTLRLWAYWHWLQAGPENPVQVPGGSSESTPLAFVFSLDVARFIANLLDAPAPAGSFRCDPVNLACTLQPTLTEFLRLLTSASCVAVPAAVEECGHPEVSFLPSVQRPWPLCCRHAFDHYGFTPTSLATALQACVGWFEEAVSMFPSESQRAVDMLPSSVRRAFLTTREASRQSSGEQSGSDSSSMSVSRCPGECSIVAWASGS